MLREDQWRAIEALVVDRRRVLCVQRTGWGKSAVYFVATALLRDGLAAEADDPPAGPTVIVSPLLALMRNQVEAAARAGIRARTINSANLDEWERDHRRDPGRRGRRPADQPGAAQQPRLPRQRAARPRRHHRPAGRRRGALRLRLGSRLPARLPAAADLPGRAARPRTPVLATTATANARVTADVAEQLGDALVLRGSLDRDSLRLAVLELPNPAHRLAWLADHLDRLPGSGIVYTLTVAAATETAEFLRSRGYAGRRRTPVRSRTPTAARPSRTCWTTRSRRWSPRPRWAWASTSPTSASSCTWARRRRRSRTTSRSAGPAARSSTPRCCCCPAPRTRRSGATSPRWRSRRRSRSGRCWPPCHRTVRCPPRALEPLVDLRRARLELMLKVLDVDGAVRRVRGGWLATGEPGPTTPPGCAASPRPAPPSSRPCGSSTRRTTDLPDGVPPPLPGRPGGEAAAAGATPAPTRCSTPRCRAGARRRAGLPRPPRRGDRPEEAVAHRLEAVGVPLKGKIAPAEQSAAGPGRRAACPTSAGAAALRALVAPGAAGRPDPRRRDRARWSRC